MFYHIILLEENVCDTGVSTAVRRYHQIRDEIFQVSSVTEMDFLFYLSIALVHNKIVIKDKDEGDIRE